MHSEPEDALESVLIAARKNFRIVIALGALAVVLAITAIILAIIAW